MKQKRLQKEKNNVGLYTYVLFLVSYVDESSAPVCFIWILKSKSERVKYPGQVCASNRSTESRSFSPS